MSPKTDLASFSEGTGFLVRRPFATLGLAALGMVLAALPPLLQIKFNLPNDDLTSNALIFAGLLPVEMYLIPRFLAEADAFRGGSPQNPHGEWEKHFEARWLKAMAGKVLLSVAIGLGILCFIIPGLICFALDKSGKVPELTAAFEAAGDSAVQVALIPPAYAARVIDELMPEFPKQLGGGPTTVLTRGISWAAAGIVMVSHLLPRTDQ